MIIARLERPRVAAGLLAALVLVLGVENGADFPLSVPALVRQSGHRYLDMCAFFSSDRVLAELTGLGERGRLWQALLFGTVDVLIPLLSFVTGLAVLGALTRATPRLRWLLAIPCAALALDLLENVSIIGLLLQYPAASPRLAGLEGLVSGAKFVAYGAVAASMALLGATRLLASRPRAATA